MMTDLSLLHQWMFLLSGMILFTSFAILEQARLVATIHVFSWQGVLVALLTAVVALNEEHFHLFFSAAMTFFIKAMLIPWMLHRLVRRLGLDHHREMLDHPALVTMLAIILVIFSYWLVLPIVSAELQFSRNIIAISLAVVLIGFLMMVVKHQAVAQVLGFMSIENGLFMAAVSATGGMPLIVELGVAFDVLVAMVLFGVFFFQIRESIDSLDVDQMNRLSEQEDTET
ncbi:MAG: formate hydrogenlyase [Gammaproteobacteria bacterium]|nr:MAG: formate hydrogenlyase [Gammaproteobacteria bacterium]